MAGQNGASPAANHSNGGIIFGEGENEQYVDVSNFQTEENPEDKDERLSQLSKILGVKAPKAKPVEKQARADEFYEISKSTERDEDLPEPKFSNKPMSREFVEDAKAYLESSKKLEDEVERVGWKPKSFSGIKTYTGKKPANPLTYSSILTNHFGLYWPGWEIETIEQEVKRKNLFNIDDEIVLDMIFALKMIYTNQEFWDDWAAFQNVTLPFNGYRGSWKMVVCPSPAQAIYAMDLVMKLRPIKSYHDHVLAFIAGSFRHHGMSVCLGLAEKAQGLMDSTQGKMPASFVNHIKETYNKVLNDLMSGNLSVESLRSMSIGDSFEEIQMMRAILIAVYQYEKSMEEKLQLYGSMK